MLISSVSGIASWGDCTKTGITPSAATSCAVTHDVARKPIRSLRSPLPESRNLAAELAAGGGVLQPLRSISCTVAQYSVLSALAGSSSIADGDEAPRPSSAALAICS